MQINAQKSQVVAFHEDKDAKSARTKPRKVRRAGGCGEQWEAAGSSQPKTGRSLRCDELAETLGRRHDFSPEALRAFHIHNQSGNRVTELRPSDYVKSGNSYYKPRVYDKVRLHSTSSPVSPADSPTETVLGFCRLASRRSLNLSIWDSASIRALP
jgi:hypothetical protein